jgi:lipopolysaccharide transport system permease protein
MRTEAHAPFSALDDGPPGKLPDGAGPIVEGVRPDGVPAPAPRGRLVYLYDLLSVLVAREMKVRYNRSVLGFAWTLLNPLAQLLVFSFVFQDVIPVGIPGYGWFLITGILAWGWFQASLHSASTSIVDNGALIRQPGFPAAILPVVTVATQSIHFLLAQVVLLPFLVLTGHLIAPALALLLPLIGLQFLLSLSLAYMVAPWQVTFRDTQYTLGVLLMLGFYLTPVLYEPAAVPTRYQPIYRLNPLVHLIGAYRAILLRGEWPDLLPLIWIAACSAGLLAYGVRAFIRASHHFIEEL